MQRFTVTLTGISPMLQNKFGDELLEQLRTKTPARKRRDWSAEEEAAEKLYTDPETGLFGIPTTNLYASLAKAGQSVQLTKATDKISTANSTKLYSLMSIAEEFLVFPEEYQSWVPDKRRGRNPNGGEAVALVRPRFDHWAVNLTIDVDETQVDPSKIRELFDIAGRAVGLGDFRPGCKGPFGRSQVTVWEPLDETAKVSGNGHKKLVGTVA